MILINKQEVKFAIGGGIIAELIFELYAWLLSPILYGTTLQPTKLVIALIQQYINVDISYSIAFGLHFLISSVGFGLFVLILRKALLVYSYISGFISGLTWWFIAHGVLVPAIGLPFMMNFDTYTQSSFLAYVSMGIIVTVVLNKVMKDFP